MSGGTGRRGLMRPGRMCSVLALWQRLNLRPLPHQHRSFGLSISAVDPIAPPGYRLTREGGGGPRARRVAGIGRSAVTTPVSLAPDARAGGHRTAGGPPAAGPPVPV